MAITPTLPRRFAALHRVPWQDARRKAAELLKEVLFHVVGGTLLLTLLTSLYIVKRALGLDLVPGVDMLPDAEIEDALDALASLLGG
jgi:hypothetical protein